MIYSNPEFVALLLVTAALFFAIPHYRARFWILLVASVIFYAWAGLLDLLVFLAVVLVSWTTAYFGMRHPKHRNVWIGTGIVLMVAHLFFWKYAGWVASEIQKLHPAFLNGERPRIPLPVGISFFTLQGIAYLIDLERDDAKFMGIREYFLFKSFFAQLVAGPIVRANQLLPQLRRLATPKWGAVAEGISLFVLGFFKKTILADAWCAPFCDPVFADPVRYGRATLVLAAVGYTVQIWADFGGYVDMGRGAARILGITLPENFRSPYLSRSLSEYWRRWHITLSEWIRDYIFTPLSLFAAGRGVNPLWMLLLAMTISGLWHGANWTFVIWGIYQGAFLVGEQLVKSHPFWKRLQSGTSVPARAGSWLYAFTAVVAGFVIFRCPHLPVAGRYFATLVRGSTEGASVSGGSWVISAIFAAFALQILFYGRLETNRVPAIECTREIVRSWLTGRRAIWAGALCGLSLLLVFAACIYGMRTDASKAFIYFQF